MADLTLRERYWAARAGMVFVTFIFSLASTIALIWMVRRRRDAARWCFTYAKFLGVLFSTYCAIDLCCFIVWIAFSRLARAAKYRGYDQVEILAGLLQGRVELSAAARMCDCVVIIFLLVALVAMGNGIILSRTGSDGEHSRLIKRAADIVSVFIGLIAAAQWGLRIRVYLEYYFEQYDINNGSEYLIGLMNIARQLDFAITLITLMSALAIMWRSVSIYLPTRAGKGIHWPSYCLLLCSSMWLLRSIYDLIYQIRYVDIEDVRDSRDEEDYLSVVTVVFYILPGLAIIWAFLGLGLRKDGGLWSTEQPWMSDNSDGSQNVPLEPRGGDNDTLPPAYSPPSSSASPSAHYQQPTEAWRESPSSTSPITQPQEIMRRPLPVGSSAVYPMQQQTPPNQSATSFGSSLMILPTPARFHNYRRASARGSPGPSQRPVVIEDAGPAPVGLGLSPVSPNAGAMPQAISPISDDGIFATPPEEPSHHNKQVGVSDATTPERYQPAPMDYNYNTGLVSPVSPVDAGPADGFYRQASPPSHDEAMGLNHQADGFRPPMSPPPPAHDEAMGLNHQADGFRPPISPPPPGHDEAMGLNHQADGRTPSTPLPYPSDKK